MTSKGARLERAQANGFTRSALTGAVALVLAIALGVGAAGASAAPLSMQFTEARANVGEQLLDDALFEAPGAPFAAQLDVQTGAITGGAFWVPRFETSITDPIVADVTVDFEIGEITGTFDRATGALSLTGTAAGTLEAIGEGKCRVSVPGELTLTTEDDSGGTNPRSGERFSNGLAGAGAIAGTWEDMVAEPVTEDDEWFCDNVEDEIAGPGGIWLEHAGDRLPPVAPQLTGTDPASPSQSGTPRLIGTAEAGSTVTVYAGAGCSGSPVAVGSAAELGSPGIEVSVAEGVTASFSATATDAVGNESLCSDPISYTRTVQPAPPGGDGGDSPPGPPAAPLAPPPATPPASTPDPGCIVPKLAGKTLKQAKKALKAAGCKLGKVTKPKQAKAKKGKGRKGQPVLVVKRSTPRRGARPVDRTVDLKLGPKPKKKARR